MGDRPLSSAFPRLYHLSLENCVESNFLDWSGKSVSFSFGFRLTFPMPDVVSLLSLVEGYDFRIGRMGVHVWRPNPLEAFTVSRSSGFY